MQSPVVLSEWSQFITSFAYSGLWPFSPTDVTACTRNLCGTEIIWTQVIWENISISSHGHVPSEENFFHCLETRIMQMLWRRQPSLRECSGSVWQILYGRHSFRIGILWPIFETPYYCTEGVGQSAHTTVYCTLYLFSGDSHTWDLCGGTRTS